MKRASEPEVESLDSELSQHETNRPTKRQKKSNPMMRLYDISMINVCRGDVEFYRNRFFTWRKINHRDDPSQSLVDKTNSWRTFVRLENENKMDFLLKKANLNTRRGSTHRTTDRSSAGFANTTNRSHSRERHQERQPKGSDSVPKCHHSANSRANELDKSAGFSAASFDVESIGSDDLHDQRSTQPATDGLRENQSTEVGLNAKTIERLWKWKSAHREQIEDLHQHYSDLTTRCDFLESRSDDHSSKLQQTCDDVQDLQKKEKARDLNNSRLLSAVEEAGSTLGTLRGEFDARLLALESVKDQSYDVLQRLYAEKKLQDTELSRLREQVETLQRQVERLQRMK